LNGLTILFRQNWQGAPKQAQQGIRISEIAATPATIVATRRVSHLAGVA
jgi:hypothetical protein